MARAIICCSMGFCVKRVGWPRFAASDGPGAGGIRLWGVANRYDWSAGRPALVPGMMEECCWTCEGFRVSIGAC